MPCELQRCDLRRKHQRVRRSISEVQSVMSPGAVSARFDDRNLIKYGGLGSVVRLAERCGLPELGSELLRWKSSPNPAGAHPRLKTCRCSSDCSPAPPPPTLSLAPP